jgi:glutamate-1-semialdehyde 2,1-aminomutase
MSLSATVDGAFRWVPDRHSPLDVMRVRTLLERERLRFRETTGASAEAHRRAVRSLPLGVPSTFQYWDPYPLSIASASGAWVSDVDGRPMLDLSMGFGAMLVGHLHPAVVAAAQRALSSGTLFVAPAEVTTEAAERICRRFGLDMVRFTNSGTESLMYAIRAARVFTGRKGLVKIEGGYHGGYDPLTVSVKPDPASAGPADRPEPCFAPGTEPGDVAIVAYNDLPALEMLFKGEPGRFAALVMEPVLENIGIVLPDRGYLQGVRELCDRYGVLLILDEVKTGMTAGVRGAAHRLGVRPDLMTLAKSIAGGLPVGAFGGRSEVMAVISSGQAAHFGTYNGNPLGMAAVIAVDDIVTDEAVREASTRNVRTLNHIGSVINDFELPAHTVGFGVKGCVSWSPTAIQNYRDYKTCDFEMAELHWLYTLNAGIITPAGLDEQWLVSFAHTEADMNLVVKTFRRLATELREPR